MACHIRLADGVYDSTLLRVLAWFPFGNTVDRDSASTYTTALREDWPLLTDDVGPVRYRNSLIKRLTVCTTDAMHKLLIVTVLITSATKNCVLCRHALYKALIILPGLPILMLSRHKAENRTSKKSKTGRPGLRYVASRRYYFTISVLTMFVQVCLVFDTMNKEWYWNFLTRSKEILSASRLPRIRRRSQKRKDSQTMMFSDDFLLWYWVHPFRPRNKLQKKSNMKLPREIWIYPVFSIPDYISGCNSSISKVLTSLFFSGSYRTLHPASSLWKVWENARERTVVNIRTLTKITFYTLTKCVQTVFFPTGIPLGPFG